VKHALEQVLALRADDGRGYEWRAGRRTPDSQEVHAVGAWVGPQIGPAKSPEARAAEERHVFMLGKSGAMALRCQYEITGKGEKLYAEVVLWHRDVGATQRELAAVSSVHSLALLGDRAFES